ncbi:protein-export membrane protein SecF [Picosynechococcus sp. PCC 7003]|uniref:protein translocase subunit SecF n=1 Tax=Picosynechococcus sp. PCC 7003 TaxID=374981 RepID=UPI000810AED4|nr:protein translocase subunit SecF [Picosynechococcus sp. PCC 7003]ANV83639.1 protein-export membrane protein SecF [Picosynechococcus sp. PCC 7003]
MTFKFSVIKQRLLWWSVSAIAILASLLFMGISFNQLQAPLRPSLDFVGGTKIQVALDCTVADNCTDPLETATIQTVVNDQGVGSSTVQILGQERTTFSVRTPQLDVDQRSRLLDALESEVGALDPGTIQIDSVGPTIGRELFIQGMLALLVSFFGIIVYLSIRFQFDYALFAIAALLHDVLITAGVFALLGLVLGVEVDSLFLVALLTIIGFSVNDTVVIYDRIRENLNADEGDSIDQIVDHSVQQTLGRSINTTLTTLLPLLAIFLFGGSTLKFFALALIIGFLCGSYSSIFVASTLLAWWRNRNGAPPTVTKEAVNVTEFS